MGILSQILANKARLAQNQQTATTVRGLLGEASAPGEFLLPDDQEGPQILPTAGKGLLGDPSLTDPQRAQLRFAGGLLGDPGARDVGATLFRGVFQDAAAMARQKAGDVAAGERSAASSLSSRQTALENAESRIGAADARFERTFQQTADLAQTKRKDARQKGLQGPVEPGMERLLDPNDPTGQTVLGDRMVAGATPFRNAEKAAIGTRDTLGIVDQVIKQIGGADGFESFGEVRGEMSSLFNQLIARRLKTREFGAPQAGEFEFLESELLNFSKLGARAGFAKKGEVLGQLGAYRDELIRSFDSQRAESGFGSAIDANIPGLRDELADAPGSFEEAAALNLTPADREEIEARKRRRGLLGGGLGTSEDQLFSLGGGA